MKKGFTLIELLVVISIIAVLSAIILPGYRDREAILTLQRAATKVAQDIRRVQEMAMSAKELPPDLVCDDENKDQNIPPRYGIEFSAESDTYIVFADCNNNGRRQPSDSVIETIRIEEKGVKISQISGEGSGSKKIWITFTPPNPLTNIRIPAHKSDAEIKLSRKDLTATVFINQAGLVRSGRVE